MNEYQENNNLYKEYTHPSNKGNALKVIVLMTAIVLVSVLYFIMPGYNFEKSENNYTKVIEKLCGVAINYTENNNVKRREPGDTVYVKIGQMEEQYLIDKNDSIDPRYTREKAQIPSSSYIRLSLTTSGSFHCEGLINNINDSTPPVLTLNGSDTIIIAKGTNLVDPGARATDDVDGDVTRSIARSGSVDINNEGEYVINYTSSDMSGNTETIERKIKVVDYKDLKETVAKNLDRIAPVIEIKGNNPYCLDRGSKYQDPGVIAKDNVDGNITSKVLVKHDINENISNNYRVTYTVTDVAGNKASAYRSVVVKSDCTPKPEVKTPSKEEVEIDYGSIVEEEEFIPEPPKPEKVNTKPRITLRGDTSITIIAGSSYSDIGATAYDAEDGDLTHKIKMDTSNVDISKGGIYYVSYEVVDSEGLAATAERIVNIKSVEVKNNVAKFNKSAENLKIKLGHEQNIEKLTATDSYGNSLNVSEEIFNSSGEKVSSLNFYRAGKYKIKYKATPQGGVTQSLERDVEIYDDISPILYVPSKIKIEASKSTCKITENFLNENGMLVTDGNNEVKPKVVLEGQLNSLCSLNETGTKIKVYAIDASNNTSETKEVNIIVTEKKVEKTTVIPVTDVEIINCQNDKLFLEQNKTLNLSSLVYPADATNKGINWSSSDTGVVQVSSTGVIKTTLGVGIATITATTIDGSKTDKCTVTVNKSVEIKPQVISVSSVEVVGCEGGKLTLEKGVKKVLSYKIKPENANNKTINWSTNNSNVSITQSGEVIAKNVGTSIITLKSIDGNKTSSCTISITEKKPQIDKTEPLKVQVITNNANSNDPYNKSENWMGGEKKKEIRLIVETVENESKIINFKIYDKKGNQIKEVLPLVNNNNRAEIIWNKDINEQITIAATNDVGLTSPKSDPIQLKLDNTGPITTFKNWISDSNKWISSNSFKLTYTAVDELSGVARYEYTHDDVKAKSATDIDYKNVDNVVELTFYESNVNKYVYVRAVDKQGNAGPWTQNPSYLNMDTIAPKPPTISVRSNNTPKVQINFAFSDIKHSKTGKESGFGKIEYKLNSENIQVITKISETLGITTPGTYKLEAWSYDKAGNKSASASKKDIKVVPSEVMATSIALNETNISLKSKETKKLIGTISPNNTTNKTITWTTSNSNVATVTSDGVIEGVSTGTATITAKVNGKIATVKVKVTVPVASVTLNRKEITLMKGSEQPLIATITPNNSTNKNITWSSDNTSVATVTSVGLVKGIEAGKAIITAKVDGKSVAVSLTVNSKEEGPIKPSGNATSSESPSLKYYITSKQGVYLTYIWMKDPYNQVKKIEANVAKYGKVYTDEELSAAKLNPQRKTVQEMLNAYTSSGKIPSGKSFVAFNASGFYVKGAWEPPQDYYHNRSSSWFNIIDGKVVRNRYNDSPIPGTTIVGIDKNNNLRLFKHIRNSEARKNLAQTIIDLGIQNTFDFNPIMLYEGKFNEERKSDNKSAHRQMICQINNNNFVMLTTIYRKTIYEAAKILENLGCKTIMNLDGGGSTQLYYRRKGKTSITKRVCRDGPGNSDTVCRSIIDGIYFIEK